MPRLEALEFNVTLLTTKSFDVTVTQEASVDVTRMTEKEFNATHLHGAPSDEGSGSAAFVMGGRRRGRRQNN